MIVPAAAQIAPDSHTVLSFFHPLLLTDVTRPGVIMATNTSSISITKIAAATQRPDAVIGMHFMNPVPVMKLVEVITGLQTSQETLATTLALAEQMGKVRQTAEK